MNLGLKELQPLGIFLDRLRTRGFSSRKLENWHLRKHFRDNPPKSKITVAVLHNWEDFEISLRDLTPNGDGVWGDVAFVPYGAVRNPDFVLVLNSIRQRWKLVRVAPERLWFASSEAPNTVHAAWNAGQGTKSTVISTAVLQATQLNGRRHIHAPPITPSWWVGKSYSELSAIKDVPKTRSLSWITSNYALLDGHRRRLAFLEKLRGVVEFDLFGRGFQPIDDKWEALAPYRYSIAFENTIAPHYFTEKLMDCFVSHTLPLYYGAPDIAKFFPEKALVKIDPDDPHVFDRVHEIISSDLWAERLPHILEAKELVLNKYNMYARLAGWIEQASKQSPASKRWIALRGQKLNIGK